MYYLDPNERMTPQEAMNHPWINSTVNPIAIDSPLMILKII